jgi:hypothetical protein
MIPTQFYMQMKQINPWQAVAFVLIVAIGGVFSLRYFGQAVAATIQIPAQVTFHGNSLQVEGTVTADCHCQFTVDVNSQSATVSPDGKFSASVPIDDSSNAGRYTVTVSTHGGFLGFSTADAEAIGNYKREMSPCRVTDYPKEWGKEEISVKVHCSPDGTLSGPGADKTLTASFDTAYDVEIVPLSFHLKQDGYADYVQDIQVTNANYDARRVAKEAKQAADEAQKAADEQAQIASIQPYKAAIQRSNDELVSAMKSMKSAILNFGNAYQAGDDIILATKFAYDYRKDIDNARQYILDAETTFDSIQVVPNDMSSLNRQWKASIQKFKPLPDQMNNVVMAYANGQEDRAVQMTATLSEKWLQLFSDTATLNQQIQNW